MFEMLLFLVNFILLFHKINSFFISMKNNHLLIECGRTIIIKNHYWFLNEFLKLLKSMDKSHSINYQQIPFNHIYLIFNHILIHCQYAHRTYQSNKKNQNTDPLYQWLKSQTKY